MKPSSPFSLLVLGACVLAAAHAHASARPDRRVVAAPDSYVVAAAGKPATKFAATDGEAAAAATEDGSFAALADKDADADAARDAPLSGSGAIEALAFGLAALGLARRRFSAYDD